MTYLNTAVAKPAGPPPLDDSLPQLETPLAEVYCTSRLHSLLRGAPIFRMIELRLSRQSSRNPCCTSGAVHPLQPSLHIHDTLAAFKQESPISIYKYMPFDAPASLSAFAGNLEWLRRMPDRCLLAVVDKQSNDRNLLAGTIAIANTDTANLSVELAPVIIYPDFQRTHVLTHAISLLLHYLFEDLGLRRVQWSADQQHTASITAASRLGFKQDGVLEWHRVLPKGKIGLEIDASQTLGTPAAGLGRHSVIMAITWEAWRDSVKARLTTLVAREVIRK